MNEMTLYKFSYVNQGKIFIRLQILIKYVFILCFSQELLELQ